MRNVLLQDQKKTFVVPDAPAVAAQRPAELLPEVQFSHHTPLLRKLKDVDMELQYNKVVNLRLAAEKIDRVYPLSRADLQLLVIRGQNLGEKRI